MIRYIKYLILCASLITTKINYCQINDSIKIKKNKHKFWLGYGLTYTGTMSVLYFAWYDSYAQSKFHWFDDRYEWLQMDKAGHAYTAFQWSQNTYYALKKIGYSNAQSLCYSAISSFIVMNSIEVFDGFSAKWGASLSDIAFNAVGTSFFAVQQHFLNKTPARLKFSFHYTPLSNLRPEALGKRLWERPLKDYNGQTYWLSLNLNDICSTFKPEWLNVAIGYGAYNMIYSTEEEQMKNEDKFLTRNLTYDKKQYRRFFISLDIDPQKIKIKNRWLNKGLKLFSIIKLPFPTFEINKHKLLFRPIYF